MNRRKKSKKGKGFIRPLLMFFNILLVLVSLAAILAGHISPDKLWQVSFAGLAYPFIMLGNVLMLIMWLPVKPRNALIPLITLAAGFNISARHLQFKHPDEFEKSDRHLRVATFNAHFYNIWADFGKPQYETLEEVESWFGSENSDILCLQEGIIRHNRTGNISERVRKSLGFNTLYAEPYFPSGSSGLITYLKGNVIETGKISHQGRTFATWADAVMRGDTIRVYNVHLQSIKLGNEEYVLENLSADSYKDSLFIKGSKQIARKLKNAFRLRSQQADLLHEHIAECEKPIILCGDLNDTPASYSYTKIRRAGLKDAFRQAGRGMGRTYRGKFPSYRIDYIFASPEIVVKSFKTYSISLSDHNPVFSWLELPEKPE